MVILSAMTKSSNAPKSQFRGDRLRDARNQAKLTQDDVEKALKLGPGQLTRYETGKSRPLPDTLIAFAELLQVSTDYLLGLTDVPNSTISSEDLTDEDRKVIHAYRNNDMSELMRLALERKPPK